MSTFAIHTSANHEISYPRPSLYSMVNLVSTRKNNVT